MHPTVRAAWPAFISYWEGRIAHMYLDTLGYVTFGVGRKIEESGRITDYGLTRPWRDGDGSLVRETVIRTEWSMINRHTELESEGGSAFRKVATLTLRDPDIDEALQETTEGFWGVLCQDLPSLPTWPADAQLAIMNMAYHLGPNFLGPLWPSFTRAAKGGDFTGCAAHCSTAKRTTRDQANKALFSVAAAVDYADLPVDQLWNPDHPRIAVGDASFLGLTSLTASMAASAKPSEFSAHAWYVQRMLARAGFYASRIDGMFGPVSLRGFAGWAHQHGFQPMINYDALAALSKATLGMPVNA